MKKLAWAAVGFLMLAQQGLWGALDASAVTWSVKNSSGNTICSGSGDPVANLPATCQSDLEFQASNGTARIEATDDGTNDILSLLSTRIVAKKDLTDYTLTFAHTFAAGPTSGDYSPIYYKTRMYGSISTSPSTNNITVTSNVENPIGTPISDLNAGPLSYSPGATTFDLATSPSTNTAMTGDRKITVNVKFTLANTKYLSFPGTSRYVRVSAQSTPDDDSTGSVRNLSSGGGVGYSSTLSEVQKILERGSKACLGISQSDGSCTGVYIAK